VHQRRHQGHMLLPLLREAHGARLKHIYHGPELFAVQEEPI
jgi:hypothetical protein